MGMQGNVPRSPLRKRAQKIPPLSHGDGKQGVCLPIRMWAANAKVNAL